MALDDLVRALGILQQQIQADRQETKLEKLRWGFLWNGILNYVGNLFSMYWWPTEATIQTIAAILAALLVALSAVGFLRAWHRRRWNALWDAVLGRGNSGC